MERPIANPMSRNDFPIIMTRHHTMFVLKSVVSSYIEQTGISFYHDVLYEKESFSE